MNAEKLARFCAIRELDYVEQGMSHGVKGAWFQTRKRVRQFFTETEVLDFDAQVKADSNRHAQVTPSFTS
ncbi:MAG: hypothetical protein KDB68_16825 [Planctomycetes bacterium]|nr:hypothetical protein [Planctomycetota bacterium]MCA8946401.1 hypothetical protein [Planctomycetota bacterium]